MRRIAAAALVVVMGVAGLSFTGSAAGGSCGPNLYAAHVERVIDGDTFVLTVKLGFGVTTRARGRLKGVDTPEIKGRSKGERRRAREAKRFVKELFSSFHNEVGVAFCGWGYYGRPLIKITLLDGRDLAQEIKKAGWEKND